MLLVLRPTADKQGLLPSEELGTILKALGFDYLLSPDQIA